MLAKNNTNVEDADKRRKDALINDEWMIADGFDMSWNIQERRISDAST